MRLLRPTAAPLLASLWLVVSLGCPASDDSTNPFDMTTGPQTTMTTLTTTLELDGYECLFPVEAATGNSWYAV